MQQAFAEQARLLGSMAVTGRPLTLGQASSLAARNAEHGLHTAEHAAKVGRIALAPIHARATANARRLGRKKKI